MLSTSWRAKGKIRLAWNLLDVPQGRREELARLTGIPAPNLSGMNTGRLVTTTESAERIISAVKNATGVDLSLEDLGATEAAAAEGESTLSRRLQELEETLRDSMKAQKAMGQKLSRLQARVRDLEGQLSAGVALTRGQAAPR